ncbi:amidohydrolase [Croceitalea marina]|uniref:Amidohydrolase n=1 Tax=Croceitalea marina TaxID=1775166 RepID=A0ABW5N1C9_9FLAO
MTKSLVLIFFIFLGLNSCETSKIEADTLVINATIWTANPAEIKVEAMAISADTILAIGTFSEVKKFQGATTEIIDVKGRFITPGFIDSHVHLLMGGNALLSVELRDASSKDEFISRIAKHTATLNPSDWIVEGNWDHTLWGGELPSKEWIDEFTSDNPVAIYRMDGHMILANSAALKIAGIDKFTPEVANGEIVRHANGEPTGILKSEAMNLVLNKIPNLTSDQKKLAIQKAQDYLLSQGVTSIHDVDSLGGFPILKKMLRAGDLKVRVYSADPLHKFKTVVKERRIDTNWLKNGLLKGFVDGSLGSHTAAFLEPYSDKENDKGLFITNPDEMYSWIVEADKKNLQITIHAIGDRANQSLLNNYEQLIKEEGAADRRLRVEHAQHLAKEDIKKIGKLGVIASVQPYHAIDDGRWAEEVIGSERIKTSYAFQSLLNNNAKLAFGSDWPVAPASPLKGIYAAVTRKTTDSKNPYGWVPKQKISVEDALIAYTINGAYASFDDKAKGSLEVGKLADFIVLSGNLLEVDSNKISDIQVLSTYIGGLKVYENPKTLE